MVSYLYIMHALFYVPINCLRPIKLKCTYAPKIDHLNMTPPGDGDDLR
jgi:hypothetical protein